MKSFAKTAALAAIAITGLALSACYPRTYDGYYDRYGTYHGDRYYNDRYYSDRYYGDRYYDRDRDGVPNNADRRPYNPYRY